MIYIKLTNGQRVMILEPANLEQLKRGGDHAVKTPDDECLIFYAPDEPWLTEKILSGNHDVQTLMRLLEEGKNRTPVFTRPKTPTLVYRAGEGNDA